MFIDERFKAYFFLLLLSLLNIAGLVLIGSNHGMFFPCHFLPEHVYSPVIYLFVDSYSYLSALCIRRILSVSPSIL